MGDQVSLQNIFEDFLNKKSIFINKDALTIRYTPKNIPHRDEQINTLAKILAPCLRLERPSNIFIYGKTGTGKTCVVQHIARQLEATAIKKEIPLKVIYINCNLKRVADTEYRLIAQLCREVGTEVPMTGLPTNEVYKAFFNSIDDKRQIIIIILDEIDNLVKKCGDEVLYNFTRINQELDNAKVSFIGISNDVTFKNNLDPRVKSSLSEEELVFPPYDALQIKDILTERANVAFAQDVISEEVISKCAAYAAREHGDARRALDLLRVAGELAEREGSDQVLEKHVDSAEEKIESDSVFEVIKHLPYQSQLVFYSGLVIQETKPPPIYTGELFDVYTEICKKVGSKILTQRRVSDLISELDMLGLFNAKVVSKGRYGRTRELSVSVSETNLDKIKVFLDEKIGISA